MRNQLNIRVFHLMPIVFPSRWTAPRSSVCSSMLSPHACYPNISPHNAKKYKGSLHTMPQGGLRPCVTLVLARQWLRGFKPLHPIAEKDSHRRHYSSPLAMRSSSYFRFSRSVKVVSFFPRIGNSGETSNTTASAFQSSSS